MTVHSALPQRLEAAVAQVLDGAGVTHVAHGDRNTMAGAEAAAGDDAALALIGPFLSRAVAHAVEATAPVGLPLIAPVATWAGVTRDDEPGCEDDPARHRGTVLRMVARDTVVAARIAAHVRAGADLIVLCCLIDEPEITLARATALPLIAFDGVQGTDLGPYARCRWRCRSPRAAASHSTTWSTAPTRRAAPRS